MKNLRERLKEARETSWSNLGKKITFFLPGMFVYNRMALPSAEAVQRAPGYGLEVSYQKTCCSVSADFSKAQW